MVLSRIAFVVIPCRRVVAVLPIVLMILVTAISENAMAAPIQIGSIDDLQKIGNDPAYLLGGSYVLTQDIDASATATWNSGAGFAPIGSAGLPFKGTFDGQGHVIVGLTINRPSGNGTGLFGFMSTGGQIKNVGLEGGTISGLNNVGELIGHNQGGAVTLCFATGAVLGTANAGALIGGNLDGPVSQCYGTGTVSGTQLLGGLIGYNQGGTVTQCYATGAVTGSDYSVGGLVGENYQGTITQCYAKGAVSVTVSGGSNVGGLVGDNEGAVTQCYAVGVVSVLDGSDVGGLLGLSHGTVDSSYWDTETSGQGSSAAGTGEPTTAMMAQATFAGWDFQNVWSIAEGLTYPFFRFSQEALRVGFAVSANLGVPPFAVAFTYRASVPEDQIVDWWWQFGDGGESHDPNPTHVYTDFGSYTVSLTVTSYEGVAVSTKYSLIRVGNQLPIRTGGLFVLAAAMMLATAIRLRRIAAAGV